MFQMRNKSRSGQDLINTEVLNPLTEICQARSLKTMHKQYSLQQEPKGTKSPNRFSEIPYQELLEQTTLKEFLTALEIVNKGDGKRNIVDQVDGNRKRKSSFVSI